MLILLSSLALISPAPGPQAAVDLGWMEGTWLSCEDGRETAETWSRAEPGLLFGHTVMRQGGRMVMWEQARVVTRDGVTVFEAMPNGAPATAFVMTDQVPHGAVFENADNDFPKTIVYERQDEDLVARISGEADDPVITWRFIHTEPGVACE